jgi:hypothetical protein
VYGICEPQATTGAQVFFCDPPAACTILAMQVNRTTATVRSVRNGVYNLKWIQQGPVASGTEEGMDGVTYRNMKFENQPCRRVLNATARLVSSFTFKVQVYDLRQAEHHRLAIVEPRTMMYAGVSKKPSVSDKGVKDEES